MARKGSRFWLRLVVGVGLTLSARTAGAIDIGSVRGGYFTGSYSSQYGQITPYVPEFFNISVYEDLVVWYIVDAYFWGGNPASWHRLQGAVYHAADPFGTWRNCYDASTRTGKLDCGWGSGSVYNGGDTSTFLVPHGTWVDFRYTYYVQRDDNKLYGPGTSNWSGAIRVP